MSRIGEQGQAAGPPAAYGLHYEDGTSEEDGEEKASLDRFYLVVLHPSGTQDAIAESDPDKPIPIKKELQLDAAQALFSSLDETVIAEDIPCLMEGEICGRDYDVRRNDLLIAYGLPQLFYCGDHSGQLLAKAIMIPILHMIHYLIVNFIQIAQMAVSKAELTLSQDSDDHLFISDFNLAISSSTVFLALTRANSLSISSPPE